MISTQNTLPYEKQYIDILKYVLKYGSEEFNERTGVTTKRIPHSVITIDLEDEFPILKSKHVAWKSAAKEILWIMQAQSNNIKDLDSKIWDSWADENGSIGKAYGYQVGKSVTMGGITYPSQVSYVLDKLSADSSDRRAVIDLWNVDDLDEMNLVPCCYSSVWNVIDGRLNCMLTQRSADFLVGVPFNTTQYAILTHLFAMHLGVRPGILTHVMADTHIYNYKSHLDGARQMIKNYEAYVAYGDLSDEFLEYLGDNNLKNKLDLISRVFMSSPIFEIDEDCTDFFTVLPDDLALLSYDNMGNIKFDVAV